MASLQAEQRPIDTDIWTELTGLLPDDCTSASLTVERSPKPEGAGEVLRLSILADGGSRVEPSDALFDAVRRLSLLMTRHGHDLRGATYRAELGEDGNWNCNARYQYASETESRRPN